MNDIVKEILEKIDNGKELVGILGLGYVGLPLAVTFAKKGVSIIGFEKSEKKAKDINNGFNYIGDIKDDDLKEVVASKKLKATTDISLIRDCDVLIICVPTPLDRFMNPNMKYIESACRDIAHNMTPGTLIILESTTYPTTTENFMLPLIEDESGLVHDKDFWVAFSPERVDPGNKDYKTHNTPKVFGALTEDGCQIGKRLYEKAINHLHIVSSPRVAEMVKVLENTYRLVNISLINELTLLADKMDINIWEVIEAAKTKPFGFQAFYPGPGVGGHCIPLDPFYLEHIAKKYDFELTLIHTAGHINIIMSHRMTVKITYALNKHKKPINGSKILFLGVAYKPNINDDRESPTLKIMQEVVKKGGIVSYHDPYISSAKTEDGTEYFSVPYDTIEKVDAVVIATNHSVFDGDDIVKKAQLVVDLRNVIKDASDKVFKL